MDVLTKIEDLYDKHIGFEREKILDDITDLLNEKSMKKVFELLPISNITPCISTKNNLCYEIPIIKDRSYLILEKGKSKKYYVYIKDSDRYDKPLKITVDSYATTPNIYDPSKFNLNTLKTIQRAIYKFINELEFSLPDKKE